MKPLCLVWWWNHSIFLKLDHQNSAFVNQLPNLVLAVSPDFYSFTWFIIIFCYFTYTNLCFSFSLFLIFFKFFLTCCLFHIGSLGNMHSNFNRRKDKRINVALIVLIDLLAKLLWKTYFKCKYTAVKWLTANLFSKRNTANLLITLKVIFLCHCVCVVARAAIYLSTSPFEKWVKENVDGGSGWFMLHQMPCAFLHP